MSDELEHYPDPPRRVVLGRSALAGLTVLERARACSAAGVGEQEISQLLATVTRGQGAPADLERGVLLMYAILLQLERRRDPSLTFETVQTFDLVLDLRTPPDPAIAQEARAVVDVAIATGIPPVATAGELTLAQLERYGERAKEQSRPRRGRRR